MGLDMYLTCNSRTLTKILDTEDTDKSKTVRFLQLDKQGVIATWYKAWAIHDWITENVEGVGDGFGTHKIMVDDLIRLRDVCKKALADPDMAQDILPTPGGTWLYDEQERDYFYNLRSTVELIDAIEKHITRSDEYIFSDSYYIESEPDWFIRFEYHASW